MSVLTVCYAQKLESPFSYQVRLQQSQIKSKTQEVDSLTEQLVSLRTQVDNQTFSLKEEALQAELGSLRAQVDKVSSCPSGNLTNFAV